MTSSAAAAAASSSSNGSGLIMAYDLTEAQIQAHVPEALRPLVSRLPHGFQKLETYNGPIDKLPTLATRLVSPREEQLLATPTPGMLIASRGPVLLPMTSLGTRIPYELVCKVLAVDPVHRYIAVSLADTLLAPAFQSPAAPASASKKRKGRTASQDTKSASNTNSNGRRRRQTSPIPPPLPPPATVSAGATESMAAAATHHSSATFSPPSHPASGSLSASFSPSPALPSSSFSPSFSPSSYAPWSASPFNSYAAWPFSSSSLNTSSHSPPLPTTDDPATPSHSSVAHSTPE